MTLRTLGLAISTSIALLALPVAAAQATNGDEPDGPGYVPRSVCGITANPSSLQSGGTTHITVTTDPNSDVQLVVSSPDAPNGAIQIAGSQTATGVANASGVATFNVTLSAPGDYTLEAAMPTAEACALSVHVEGVVEGEEDSEADEPDEAEALAATGADTLPYLLGAVALAGLGTAGVVISRRRRTS